MKLEYVVVQLLVCLSRQTTTVGWQPAFRPSTRPASVLHLAQDIEWEPLVESDARAVQKSVLAEGTGVTLEAGAEIEIEYRGTIASQGEDWTPQEVVDSWLTTQQGLDAVAPAFLEAEIDGAKLLDESYFNEDLVANTLGVENRIQCKKLVMAAKRLAKQQSDRAVGYEFDAGSLKMKVGAGKVIRGMEAGVSSMSIGESALVRCRSDYAYGSEGYRKSTGEIVVPPYASLCFEIKVLEG